MKKINPNFDEFISKNFINDLKKEPLLSEFNINEYNANILFTKLNDYKNCDGCKGLKDCKNDTVGFFNDVITDNNSYKNILKMCDFKKEQIQILATNNMIKTLYMPKSILRADINDIDLSTETRKKIFHYIVDFNDNYRKNNFIKGLSLHGAYGIGKTYILAALANELAKKNIESLIIYFPDMSRELKGALGSPRFDELINMLKSIDVLIIDDLGAEMLTPWLRDEVIGPIINYRSGEKLPIFISSNLNVDELNEHFSLTREGLDNTKGTRIMTRIQNLVKIVDMPPDVYRK